MGRCIEKLALFVWARRQCKTPTETNHVTSSDGVEVV